MILYLIRHGQSTNNLLAEELRNRHGPFSVPYDTYMSQRVAEPPLTAIGEAQAKSLGVYVNELRITRLYSSPMLRSMQTMRPIAEAMNLAPSVWTDLHEQGGLFLRPGADAEATGFPGLNRSEVEEMFPGYLSDGIGEKGWWHGAEEDMASCYARAVRVAGTLRQMAQDTDNGIIAAISHGTFMDSLLKALLGRLPGNDFYFNHHNTAITRVDFVRSQTNSNLSVLIRYTNRVDHLTAEFMTY